MGERLGDGALITIQHRQFTVQAERPLVFALIKLVASADMHVGILLRNLQFQLSFGRSVIGERSEDVGAAQQRLTSRRGGGQLADGRRGQIKRHFLFGKRGGRQTQGFGNAGAGFSRHTRRVTGFDVEFRQRDAGGRGFMRSKCARADLAFVAPGDLFLERHLGAQQLFAPQRGGVIEQGGAKLAPHLPRRHGEIQARDFGKLLRLGDALAALAAGFDGPVEIERGDPRRHALVRVEGVLR